MHTPRTVTETLIKFRSGPWRTVLNSPRTKRNVCIFVYFGAFTMNQFLSWMVWRSLSLNSIILGVICDKLSFIPYINYLKAKCHKAQLLRVVAHTDWGADKSTLLKIYRSLVRSKLDYGCLIYGSARKFYLRCLDSIHHLGLRLALGALQTSPVESLYVEALLSLRREELAFPYYTKLQSCPSNMHSILLLIQNIKIFCKKGVAIPTSGIRIQSLLENSNIPNNNIHETIIPEDHHSGSSSLDFTSSKG